MNKNLATAFALTAATLFVGCGKQSPSPSPPDGGDASPASDDATEAASDEATAEADGADVKCFGVNECSGQGACDVAGSHECGGQNTCKGKGWILLSQRECESKGGKIL